MYLNRFIYAVEAGVWVESDSGTIPDLGEDYIVTVSNRGTVTPQNTQLSDTSGVVTGENTMPSTLLASGETQHCTVSRKVR